MSLNGITPAQTRAIHAARNRLGLDYDTYRDIIEQESHGRTTTSKELSRGEAHRVLDRLNGKNPDTEDGKRASYSGTRRRQDAKGAKGNRSSGNGTILRHASKEQRDLLDELGRQAGFTINLGPNCRLERTHLEDWLRNKFDLPATSSRTGKLYIYTGEKGVISEGGAQKVIGALRAMVNTRRALWLKAYDWKTSQAVVELGVPYEYDKRLRENRCVEAVLEEIKRRHVHHGDTETRRPDTENEDGDQGNDHTKGDE